jgi:alanyl-tRNA synthetase
VRKGIESKIRPIMGRMRTAEIRERFLSFFESKGHLRLPSFSLIPQDDPSLLFINAGMTPLKPYFLGKPPVFPGHEGLWYRVTTCQKCVRTADIENVGRTNRHQTVFEMLGNFSFGDYFKAEAIAWAFELLTGPLGILAERLYTTVYEEDDEAFRLWQEVGIPAERIHRFGADENFWPENAPTKGPNGPCGPSSEIYFDRGPAFGQDTWEDYRETRESQRFIEIWNLVFPQYNRLDGGILEPLPRPNIDTGMGLSRVAMVLQGVRDFYETDDFLPLIEHVVALSGRSYEGPSSIAHRVIVEHARAVAFMASDGVTFSNTGRGYVLRRLLRRAARHGFLLGLKEPFLYTLLPKVAEILGDVYPELREHLPAVERMVRREEERFLETLELGLKRLEQLLNQLPHGGVLPGTEAFRLYDTYGFPLDLTLEIAGEQGVRVDTQGFEQALAEQQERARAGSSFERNLFRKVPQALLGLLEEGGTEFVGYETLEETAEVRLLLLGEQPLEVAQAGMDVEVVLNRTPFYAEGGGQVGDAGILEGPSGWAQVLSTRKTPEGIYLHQAKVKEGLLRPGEVVRALVDAQRRRATERNHTATHLLHAALRALLGPQARQAGSYVGPDRLRFDFSHHEPLSAKQLRELETKVNGWIQENLKVRSRILPLEQARQEGAMALFEEKYGDLVRVIEVGEAEVVSRELCGGCHVRATGEIGLFLIQSEEGVASGIRRIEALTGTAALSWTQESLALLKEAAHRLGGEPKELLSRLERLQEELKTREKELQTLRRDRVRSQLAEAKLGRNEELSWAWIELPDLGANELRQAADELLDRHNVDLAAVGSQGQLVLKLAPKALHKGLDARALLHKLAETAGGRGGGRSDLAQGGGFELPRAFQLLEELLLHNEIARPE